MHASATLVSPLTCSYSPISIPTTTLNSSFTLLLFLRIDWGGLASTDPSNSSPSMFPSLLRSKSNINFIIIPHVFDLGGFCDHPSLTSSNGEGSAITFSSFNYCISDWWGCLHTCTSDLLCRLLAILVLVILGDYTTVYDVRFSKVKYINSPSPWLIQVRVHPSSSNREKYYFCCFISYILIDDATTTTFRLLIQFWSLCYHCPCFLASRQVKSSLDSIKLHVQSVNSITFIWLVLSFSDSFFKDPRNYVWWFIDSIHHQVHALVEYWCSYYYFIEYWATDVIFLPIQH